VKQKTRERSEQTTSRIGFRWYVLQFDKIYSKNEETAVEMLQWKNKFLSFRDHFLWRGCSSVVEHLPFKQRVDGSSPSSLTKKLPCGSGEIGRHTILRGWRSKGHAGSSPAFRTRLTTRHRTARVLSSYMSHPDYQVQGVGTMLKKFFFLSVLALLLTSIPLSAQSNEEAKKLFNEGNALLKAGDYNGAIDKFDAALKLEKHEFYYYQRGLAQKRARKMDESLESFKSAVKMNPEWAVGYVALAGAYFGKGDYSAAIENYKTALKQNPTLGPAKKGLAAAQTAQAQTILGAGDISGAIELCKNAIAQDEEYDKAYLILAQAQNKNGNYEEAIKAAQNAIKHMKSTRKGAAYFELGLAHRNLGNTAKAKDAFINAKKDPSYARNADYELNMLR
jgi:tetratricopeptide (TPR) repeat protein